MAENGASRTDLTTVPYGVLKDVGVDDKYINLAQALAGKPREVDPAMAAFLYFSKMGELASQPGATLFGSAAGAASSPAEYIMGIREANRKAEADVPATAINLMKALKPSTAGATTYKSIIVTMSDGTTKKDYVPASEIASIKALDGVVSVAEDTSASSTTGAKKPYDVVITDVNAFNTAFPNVNLPEDNTIPLTSDQVSLLPMGSYQLGDTSTTGKATKPFDIEILDKNKFLTIFPNTPIPENNVISINSQDADLLPVGSFKLYEEAKSFSEKYLQQQTVVYAKNEVSAKKILSDLGVKETDTEYEGLLDIITTDDSELFGRPVIIADQYVNFYKPRNENSGFNVIVRAPGGGAVPPEVTTRNEEIKKLVPIQITQQATARELIPTLEGALAILMQNPNITGAFQRATMEARNLLSSAFGFTSSELEDQKFLTALSNKLAPKMRPVGSGSTSDMEFKAYKQAILDMGNPVKTNYLTMYSLKRTTEAAVEEINLRRQLLSQGKSETYIANKILERPATIYEKFKTVDENGNDLYQQGDEAQFVADRDRWFNSLPNGAVILNKDSRLGNKIFPASDSTLIIKGWRGDQ